MEAFRALEGDELARAIALAPPSHLPAPIAALPKDTRRRLASAPKAVVDSVLAGEPFSKKKFGGYPGTDFTHSLFSAPALRFPMAFAEEAFHGRGIPPGNEYIQYLEGLKAHDPDEFEAVCSGVSGVPYLGDAERAAGAPLSADVGRVLENIVEWRVQFAMTPGTRDSHPVNRGARLSVALGDLRRALGLSVGTAAVLERVAGPRVRGGVLSISSKGWRSREDNRRQAMEWLQNLVAESVRLSGQAAAEAGPGVEGAPGGAFSGDAWVPSSTRLAARVLEAAASGAGRDDPKGLKHAADSLSQVPHGLEVPRTGLTSAALLAGWPGEAIGALRELAKRVEAGVGVNGRAKGSRAASGGGGGGAADGERERLASVVYRQVQRDFARTQGVADAMRAVEEKAGGGNAVVSAWKKV